jgi:ribosomal protein S19
MEEPLNQRETNRLISAVDNLTQAVHQNSKELVEHSGEIKAIRRETADEIKAIRRETAIIGAFTGFIVQVAVGLLYRAFAR